MSHIKKGLMFGMFDNKLADSEKAFFCFSWQMQLDISCESFLQR